MFLAVCKKMGIAGGVSEYRFDSKRKWRCDFAFPEIKLCIEIDGGVWMSAHNKKSRHFYGQGAVNDMEKMNALTEHGYYLLRYQPNKIDYNQILKVYNILSEQSRRTVNGS